MNKFEGFALDVVLADYPDNMSYEEIIDYLEEDYDSDLDSELFVLQEFEHETGAHIAQRIEDMRATALRWFSDPDDFAVRWSVTDVLGVADTIEVPLGYEQAREVLSRIIKNHDASVGINFDVIADSIEVYLDDGRA